MITTGKDYQNKEEKTHLKMIMYVLKQTMHFESNYGSSLDMSYPMQVDSHYNESFRTSKSSEKF